MNKKDFIINLKKLGKKEHVIETLVSHVLTFEKYLKKVKGKDLDLANVDDLIQFLDQTKSENPNLAKKYCRGISLYYKNINKEIYLKASNYRQTAIKKTRREFPLKEFIGLNPENLKRLENIGIKTAPQMLKICTTDKERKTISRQTKIPLKDIVEIVKLSDLARMTAVRGVRARLYYDAGIDMIEKMAGYDPKELREYLAQYIKKSKFPGITPLPKELTNTIIEAKKLKPVIEY